MEEIIVNCETGEQSVRRLSRAEVKARQAAAAAAAAGEAARHAAAAQRQADIETLVRAAETDPVAAAAARLLGLQ